MLKVVEKAYNSLTSPNSFDLRSKFLLDQVFLILFLQGHSTTSEIF